MSSEFGLRGPKTPWVCPSDRQLALRAKLRTGWSIKTNQFNTYPKPSPLTEKEQQMIVSVIQKAEELDLNEQHRVGKLVDRLENLKRLASGNGVTQCILCGDTFGLAVFGRNSYTCCDCKKAVCRKCVVDLNGSGSGAGNSSSGGGSCSTPSSPSGKDGIVRLCKLCSENREFLKKSGAWFYKGVPKYVLPEKKSVYANGRLGGANVREKSSGGAAASVTDLQEKRFMRRYMEDGDLSSVSTTSNKRSAVWTKNLPEVMKGKSEVESSSSDEGVEKGLLKANATSSFKRAGSIRRGSRRGERPAPIITSSIPTITTVPEASGGGGNESSSSGLGPGSPPLAATSSTFSTSPVTPGGFSNHSSSPPPYSPPSGLAKAVDALSASRSILRRLKSGGSKSNSCSSDEAANFTSTDDKHHDVFNTSFDKHHQHGGLSGQKSTDQTMLEHSPPSPFQLMPGDPHGGGGRSSSSSFDSGIRRSMSSLKTTSLASNSPPGSSPSPAAAFNSTSSSSSASSSSISSYQRRHPPPPPPTSSELLGFGILEISLLFDDSQQALHCSIHRAKDLTPMDIHGLSDPYCMLQLKPTRFEGTHVRTKTVHKALHPVFNETLTFYGVTQNEVARQTLQIDVMDEDRWARECLGTAQVALHKIKPQQTKMLTLSLEKPRMLEDEDWGRGRLQLSLCYMADKSLLLVGVIRAEGLPTMDQNGTSQPFVRVKLLQDANVAGSGTSTKINGRSINRKFNMSIKWKTVNPEFREEFSLKVPSKDLPKLALAVSVIDKVDQNYIGGILLSTSSKGQRLRHWTDMLKYNNRKHLKWHILSPSMIPQ